MSLFTDSLARERFEKDGVICLKGVLSTCEIEGLRRSVDKQFSEIGTSPTAYDFESIGRQIWTENQVPNTGPAARFDTTAMKARVDSDKQARPLLELAPDTQAGQFHYDVAGWKRFNAIRRVAFDSSLPQISAFLLRSHMINFWEDTTFAKTPGTLQKTAFHQDKAYFQIKGDQCAVVWVPLDPADLSNGVTEYVRGSHLWGEEYAPNIFVAQTPTKNAKDPRLPDIEGNRDRYDIVSFDVEPGDVIVHHVNTVHGAGGNLSSRNRRAISFRYCGDDIVYWDRPGAINQYGIEQPLETGEPLCNSADYPMVWPKPWPGMNLSDFYQLYLYKHSKRAS